MSNRWTRLTARATPRRDEKGTGEGADRGRGEGAEQLEAGESCGSAAGGKVEGGGDRVGGAPRTAGTSVAIGSRGATFDGGEDCRQLRVEGRAGALQASRA